MPVDNSLEVDTRATERRRRTNNSWIIVVFAIISGILLGYVFRPTIDNLSNRGQTDPVVDGGLSDLAKTQVKESITQAMTPVTTSLDEIKALVQTNEKDVPNEEDATLEQKDGSDQASDTERISSELNSIRLMLNDRVSYVEQLIKAGDDETRANLDAFVAQTGQQLNQINYLENSVNQLAAEFPRLQNTIRTLRPAYDDQNSDSGSDGAKSSAPKSVVETDFRPAQPMGTLVINNTSTRTATIIVNGESQELQPGRNAIIVPVTEIELQHPESSTAWTLDPSLWDLNGDQYVMTRTWRY